MVGNHPFEEQQSAGSTLSREMPGDTHAALAIMLECVSGYFRERADANDVEALEFSLRHLFGCAGDLFRLPLPTILESETAPDHERTFGETLLQRQHLWTHLRSIKFAVSRIEPLCRLLNNAAERLLDALDNTTMGEETANDDTIPRPAFPNGEQAWQPRDQAQWEEAFAVIMAALRLWHERYSALPPFTGQFAHLSPALADLPRIDEMFSILLDCTGAIFGDIIPGFQGISANDDEAVCVLLLDLMQQSDQLLEQFDAAITPLHMLIEQYTPGIAHS